MLGLQEGEVLNFSDTSLMIFTTVDFVSDCMFIYVLSEKLDTLEGRDEIESEEYRFVQGMMTASIVVMVLAALVNLYFFCLGAPLLLQWSWHEESHKYKFTIATCRSLSILMQNMLEVPVVIVEAIFYSPIKVLMTLLQSLWVGIDPFLDQRPAPPIGEMIMFDRSDASPRSLANASKIVQISHSLGWGFWFDAGYSRSFRAFLSPLGSVHMMIIAMIISLQMMIADLLYFVIIEPICSSILLVVVNCLLFALAMTNAEFNYRVYGRQDITFYRYSTVLGMIVEVLPQVIVQLIYAIVANVYYGQVVVGLQWFSFASFAWMMWYAISLKFMRWTKDPPITFRTVAENEPHHIPVNVHDIMAGGAVGNL